MSNYKIGVLGAGVMGGGIAQTAAMKGFEVVLCDVEMRFVEDAIKRAISHMDKDIQKQKMTVAEKEAVLQRITPTTNSDDFASVDFVVEAIVEDLTIKKDVFARLDKICRSDTILTTNTSSMSITAIASATSRPDKVTGMHFFIPPTIMELVEITRGYYTSDETVAQVKAVAKQMGKTSVEVKKDTPGFIANRIYTPLFLEAFKVYEEGIASKGDIDMAMKLAYGLPIGPFELADYIGLDVLQSGLDYFHKELGSNWRPPLSLKQMINAGRFGKKTGKGWYNY